MRFLSRRGGGHSTSAFSVILIVLQLLFFCIFFSMFVHFFDMFAAACCSVCSFLLHMCCTLVCWVLFFVCHLFCVLVACLVYFCCNFGYTYGSGVGRSFPYLLMPIFFLITLMFRPICLFFADVNIICWEDELMSTYMLRPGRGDTHP